MLVGRGNSLESVLLWLMDVAVVPFAATVPVIAYYDLTGRWRASSS